MLEKSRIKENIKVADLSQLAEDLLQGLGATATVNGDRGSEYFVLAKDEAAGTDLSVSLIEERANLPESEWGYSLHVIDDITPSDCDLCQDAGLPLEPKTLVTLMLAETLNGLLGIKHLHFF